MHLSCLDQISHEPVLDLEEGNKVRGCWWNWEVFLVQPSAESLWGKCEEDTEEVDEERQ